MKLAAWHMSNAGRQRDKRADHWEQACDEHRRVTPARKKTIGPIEFAAAHQNPAAVALHQRTSTVTKRTPASTKRRASKIRWLHAGAPQRLEALGSKAGMKP